MKKKMKKKMKNEDTKLIKTSNFEKKPTNGGIPAIENRTREMEFEK
jgi:hypothetical protein